jgi:hypothetical protein
MVMMMTKQILVLELVWEVDLKIQGAPCNEVQGSNEVQRLRQGQVG